MATITALKNPSTVAAIDNYSPGSSYCELIGHPSTATGI